MTCPRRGSGTPRRAKCAASRGRNGPAMALLHEWLREFLQAGFVVFSGVPRSPGRCCASAPPSASRAKRISARCSTCARPPRRATSPTPRCRSIRTRTIPTATRCPACNCCIASSTRRPAGSRRWSTGSRRPAPSSRATRRPLRCCRARRCVSATRTSPPSWSRARSRSCWTRTAGSSRSISARAWISSRCSRPASSTRTTARGGRSTTCCARRSSRSASCSPPASS